LALAFVIAGFACRRLCLRICLRHCG
jgi:hypothetical protein